MGIEIELAVLMLLQLTGSAFFSHFEGEQSPLRKIMKWIIFDGITIGLFFLVGHWALLFPAALLFPGAFVHVRWCRKNGIHPVKATPRKKYYELRGWKWEE